MASREKKVLRSGINGYNNAGRHRPWIVLVDLDQEADCAPNLCRAWISQKSQKLCFRVAVREVEAWLLSDRESIARFLSVPVSRVPIEPESELNPKQTMVNLAAKSKRRSLHTSGGLQSQSSPNYILKVGQGQKSQKEKLYVAE